MVIGGKTRDKLQIPELVEQRHLLNKRLWNGVFDGDGVLG